MGVGNSTGKKGNSMGPEQNARTFFQKDQLQLLGALYDDLARRNEDSEMDKATFLDFFNVPKLLGERLFQVFDQKKTGVIDLEEFLDGLATYAKGTMEEKMEMLFYVYDLNDEQAVNKEELRMMLFSLVTPAQSLFVDEVAIPEWYEILDKDNRAPFVELLNHGAELPQEAVIENLISGFGIDAEQATDLVKWWDSNSVDQSRRESSRMKAFPHSESDIEANTSTSSQMLIGAPTDPREAVLQMVEDAFAECDVDQTEKLTIDQFQMFIKKHPALVENLEYALLGSVWDFIHPEDLSRMGLNMAEQDEYNTALGDEEDRGLRLHLVAEDFRSLHYCEESKVEVWVGGAPRRSPENSDVTQISLESHGGPKGISEIKFCPFTGKKLIHVEDHMTERVQVQNLSTNSKKQRNVHKAGDLYVKKQWNRFSKRYFIINGPFLYVFHSREDVNKFDVVNYILGFFVEPISRLDNNKYGIKLIPPAGSRNQPLTLFCVSDEERISWISALQKAAKTSKIEDSFNMLNQIGSGQFSEVFKARNKTTGQEVAVKKINKSKLDAREKEAIQNEIAICQLVNHPNVIRLKQVYETQRSMYLVMPLLQGDLFSLLKQRKRLPEATAKLITWKMLDALKYLHALGIVHRDLKPENILMKGDDETDIVIADFGLSKFAMPHERLQLACGTVAYVAPEVLRLRGYDRKCDLWSVGIILYLMLRGKLPFDASSKKDIIRMTLSRPANLADPYWRQISNQPKNLISKLLKKNPDNRIDLETAMEHVWFDDVRVELEQLRSTRVLLTSPMSPVGRGPVTPTEPPKLEETFESN